MREIPRGGEGEPACERESYMRGVRGVRGVRESYTCGISHAESRQWKAWLSICVRGRVSGTV